ncbi:MAG: chemotaxis protein CheB [Planctomycetota bacterium]
MTQDLTAESTQELARPTFIVGIGASAGGLEPLEQFFAATPPITGMAFVVVQHLSPDYPSLMSELLARHTSLPIRRVEDGMAVGRDAIYLIPARKNMIIEDGVLRLFEQERDDEQPPLPIDVFFRSLAKDCGDKAVAIVLSGTGTDGSRGIADIKKAGGIVIVQDKVSAKFTGMPRAASDTGAVDVALAPDEMPSFLAAYAEDPSRLPSFTDQDDETLEGMEGVLRLLNTEHEIDFSLYKPSTVHRRIERRIMLGTDDNINQYVDRLKNDPDELHQLYKDLLIGVTQFFRDAAAFQSLGGSAIKEIFEQRGPQEEVRVWVAGCATGEEAYSIAMLLDEERRRLGRENQPIRVFATDAHRSSVDFAATGRYPADRLREVMPDRLSEYFTSVGTEFQVTPRLRQMITFATHNLISDAPFTRMDLVTCRNVLIYFKKPLQTQVISLLHFAMNANGFMFLGPSETTQPFRDEFETIDSHWRIYRKRRDVRLISPTRLPTRTPSMRRAPVPSITPQNALPLSGDTHLMRVYDQLLGETIGAAILVNERREVLHVFGEAGAFLHVPIGRRTFDVLAMIDEPLKTAVGAAIQKGLTSDKMETVGRVRIDDETTVLVSASPINAGNREERAILVRLDTAQTPKPEHPKPSKNIPESKQESTTGNTVSSNANDDFDASGANEETIVTLEQELQYTKETLQSTIEELETANEELNATNEELIASNEELQSTNEELHSVNEELHTVNAEYQQKITELTQLTDDMNNLLSSTAIGTVFVDRDLNVRRFTPSIKGLFNLRDADLGRPLAEISPVVKYSALIDDARMVLETGQVHEHETEAHDGTNLLIRFNPYLLNNGNINGLVITTVDITKIKQAEKDTEEERVLTQRILDTLPAMVIFKDDENRILRINQTVADWVKLPRDQIEGRHSSEIFGEELAAKYYQDDLQVLRAGKPVLGITEKVDTDAGTRWVRTDKVPLVDSRGRKGLVAVVSDITDLHDAQSRLEALTQRFEAFMSNSPAMKWAVDEDNRYIFVNDAYCQIMRVEREEIIGKKTSEVLSKQTSEAFLKRSRSTNNQALSAGQPITFEIEVPVDENVCWMYVTKFIFEDANGNQMIGGSALDITELKRVESELKQVNEELESRVTFRTAELTEARDKLESRVESRTSDLRMRNEQLDQFARVASHDLRSPLRTIIGYTEILSDRAGLDDPLVKESLESIIRAGNRMTGLIDALSSFSRIGRTPLQTEEVNLNDVIRQCREDLAAEVAAAEATIVVEPLPTVQGDHTLLRQVVQNLITNAIKFVGEDKPRVEIGPIAEGEAVFPEGESVPGGGFYVQDHGIGIEPDFIETIFEPFTRLYPNHEYPGSGVGLSICRRIINNHGGVIFLESELGKGTRFSVVFPPDRLTGVSQ